MHKPILFVAGLLIPILLLAIWFLYDERGEVITLDKAQAELIGQKIWQNEGARKEKNLTVWNQGEAFPSFGIGHFIWYPEGVEETFTESFPQLIAHLQQEHPIPAWLLTTDDSPWRSRDDFYQAFDTEKMRSLRELMYNTIAAQTQFIVLRMQQALPKILQHLPASQHERITQRFLQVLEQEAGPYALIDYVNFKGEGIAEKERYQNQGWGLLQVLQNMEQQNQDVMDAFADAAELVLTRRVANAPRDESRWLPGWKKRIQTYRMPLALLSN